MLQKISKIYNNLEDTQSKDIFEFRRLYSDTFDLKYINQIVEKYFPEAGLIYSQPGADRLCELAGNMAAQNKDIIIYGAGKIGQVIHEMLRNAGIEVKYFSDINPDLQRTGVHGLKVISPQTLVSQHNRNAVIILAVWAQFHKSLIELFTTHGISNHAIINGLEFVNFQSLTEHQYFEPNIIEYVNDEIFIDGGCFDFHSSIQLSRKCHTLKKIYAFEPDKENIVLCKKAISAFDKCPVELLNAGLWSCQETLSFNSYGGGGSCVAKSGETQIPVVALDDIVKNDRVTFIKMDIEGSELEALKGACKTIKRFKPKLAISLYHKPEDIIDIPDYIMDLDCGYRFYIRHYTNWTVDTVLYAV